ncbi:hypothetical protein H9I45_07130 [Polaribacter haliotis]|uniref:Magnesium citrate secondary transporter n=1 Tax=Polaribacter haliotis TaxID=1888915 RepID=A0A7L8AJR7_9FLAO|nr:hypothetical protein [Polaribacter haliotis]QOD62207.1 hypothetical protein H9I45_07130 [Polaribacter haliotis]
MKNILFKYVLFSFLLGSFIYFSSLFNVQLPQFVRFYVNDFLIIPIVLFLCLQVLKQTKNNPNYKIPFLIILYLCFLYSLLFEFVFPNYLARYTKDYIDILLYFAGGIVFYQLQKIDT